MQTTIMIISVILSVLGIFAAGLFFILYMIAMHICNQEGFLSDYNASTSPRVFITGDKHRYFDGVKKFCRRMNTRREDVLIILGLTHTHTHTHSSLPLPQ